MVIAIVIVTAILTIIFYTLVFNTIKKKNHLKGVLDMKLIDTTKYRVLEYWPNKPIRLSKNKKKE